MKFLDFLISLTAMSYQELPGPPQSHPPLSADQSPVGWILNENVRHGMARKDKKRQGKAREQKTIEGKEGRKTRASVRDGQAMLANLSHY